MNLFVRNLLAYCAEGAMLEKLVRVSSYIALLVLAGGASVADAATWTRVNLSFQITDSEQGYATTSVNFPDEILGHSYNVTNILNQLPQDNNYYNITNSIHCYPLGGGSYGFYNPGIRNLTNTHQTSNNAFGAPDCSVSGDYYIVYRDITASSTILYVASYFYNADTDQFSINATPTFDANYETGFNNVLNTRFTDLNITGTSSINIDVDYYLDGQEINPQLSHRNPTYVKFWFGTTTNFSKVNEVIPVIAGTGSVSTTLSSLSDGNYSLLIGFSNFGCSVDLSACPFPDSYVYSGFTINGGVLTATSSNEFYDLVTPNLTIQYQPCSLTEIGGCIINAGLFLIIPSEDSMNNILSTKEEMETKIPFVYVADMFNVMAEIFNTEQTETLDVQLDLGFGTVTLIDEEMIAAAPQAALVRELLAAMLWVVFAMGAYRMALGIHNKETT